MEGVYVNEIRASQPPPPQEPVGQPHFDIPIPKNKVGLVIGKRGKTIKNLQMRSGVKMDVIKKSLPPDVGSKILRITGDADKIEDAKQLVNEVINSRPRHTGAGGNSSNMDKREKQAALVLRAAIQDMIFVNAKYAKEIIVEETKCIEIPTGSIQSHTQEGGQSSAAQMHGSGSSGSGGASTSAQQSRDGSAQQQTW